MTSPEERGETKPLTIIGIDAEFMNNNTHTSNIFAIGAAVFHVSHLDNVTFQTELTPVDRILLTTRVQEPINADTERWWKTGANGEVYEALMRHENFVEDHDEFVQKFRDWYAKHMQPDRQVVLVSDEVISDVGRISHEIDELLCRTGGDTKVSAGLRFLDDRYVVEIIDVSTYIRAYYSARHRRPGFLIYLPDQWYHDVHEAKMMLKNAPELVGAQHTHNPLDDTLEMMGRFFGLLAKTNESVPEQN